MPLIKIGTRGSKLAVAQADIVSDALRKNYPEIQTEIVIIKTKGDKILDKPLQEIGGKGLFVEEIEDALFRKEIDIAVHSAKDLPLKIKDGLEICCTPKRADARDVLIISRDSSFDRPLIIGTSSPRREMYLKRIYPDSTFKMIRGNIDTRLRKLSEKEYDAIVLAKAGLDRLGLPEKEENNFVFSPFDTKTFLPAACQGIISIEAREDFQHKDMVLAVNDERTYFQYQAERKVLELLQADCREPAAAYCELFDDGWHLELSIMYAGREVSIKSDKVNLFSVIEKLVEEVRK